MGKVYLTLDEVLTRRSISRYELAKVVRYDSYVLEKICSALDCTAADLIRYEK